MSEYNQYVDAVNKIFEHISRLKLAIMDQDNLSAVENIESYKQTVIDNANLFSNKAMHSKPKEEKEMIEDDDMEDIDE